MLICASLDLPVTDLAFVIVILILRWRFTDAKRTR